MLPRHQDDLLAGLSFHYALALVVTGSLFEALAGRELMSAALDEVRTMDDLRSHIHRKLSEKENLVSEQFSLQETPLTRGAATCGYQFVLFGPRQVKLTAVWSADQRSIYFYDARGERFLRETLVHNIEVIEMRKAS